MNIKAQARLTIEKSDHPNRLPFTGVLLYLDNPSQQAPHGSEGHRIHVTRDVAEKRLNTLVGMPLNYSGSLDGHDSRNAVGVITKPWIDGNKVMVQGYIWKKTFPEAKEDLHGKALGMSMELADVMIEDKDADVWNLEDFYFTGATALWPDSAAYTKTALAAAAAGLGKKGATMDSNKKKKPVNNQAAGTTAKILATAISASVAERVQTAMIEAQKPMITALTDLVSVVKDLKASGAKLPEKSPEEKAAEELTVAIQAGSTEIADDIDAAEDTEEEEEEEEVKAQEEETEEEEEEEEEEEMEGAGGSDNLSNVNDDVANKGNKTTETGPAGGKSTDMRMSRRTSKTVVKAMKAAAGTINTLKAQLGTVNKALAEEKKARKRMESKIEAMELQLEAAAERTNRRTVTPELKNFLEKNNFDINAAQSGGRKLSVEQFDQMVKNLPFNVDVEQRMAWKHQMVAAGLMEDGLRRIM